MLLRRDPPKLQGLGFLGGFAMSPVQGAFCHLGIELRDRWRGSDLERWRGLFSGSAGVS